MQVAWFEYVFSCPAPALQADMLAVYGGDPPRYALGWAVERQGRFNFLVFSDAHADFLAQMKGQYGPPRAARLLLEPRARSTAQNARYVAVLIRDHGCRSVLVITSWWHLPRALFLTHLALLGSGVEISGLGSELRPSVAWNDRRVWEELIRFWGSLLTFTSDTHNTSFL
ncbi:MAG TPA: YdcF family protein [bacterium]|jgi:hypothetical protein|nr:YdcF family protein [bacterium]